MADTIRHLEGVTLRRDQVRPGDTVISSHYGRRVVESAEQRGDAGQTTELRFQNDHGRVDNEIYPSDSLIEVVGPFDGYPAVATRHRYCATCDELGQKAREFAARVGAAIGLQSVRSATDGHYADAMTAAEAARREAVTA